MSGKIFVCSWDNLGFEAIVDMTTWERNSLLKQIKGEELDKPPVSLHYLTLRARMNPERNPEVWVFNTTDSITEEELKKFAEEYPQELADLIRSKGKQLWGQMTVKNPRII